MYLNIRCLIKSTELRRLYLTINTWLDRSQNGEMKRMCKMKIVRTTELITASSHIMHGSDPACASATVLCLAITYINEI